MPRDRTIPDDVVDAAIKETGGDPHNEIQRERFRVLVKETGRVREVVLNIDDYRKSALEAAGPTAPDSEIVSIAWNMKEGWALIGRKEHHANSRNS